MTLNELMEQTLNRRLDNILKDSLKGIYMDCPEIIEALNSIDFSKVNWKFRNEMFKRITPKEFVEVDAFLCSDVYRVYKNALDQAALACTTELGELIYFVTTEGQGGDLN